MALKGSADIVSKLKRAVIREVKKILTTVTIIIVVLVLVFAVITKEARIGNTKKLQRGIYESLGLDSEDLSELVEIKGDESTGYHLEFVEDIDEKLKKVFEEDKEIYEAAGIENISTLKKFIRAQMVTEYPNLGSSIGAISGMVYPGKTYQLTEEEKKILASLVYGEYGYDIQGMKAVASFLCNLYEYQIWNGSSSANGRTLTEYCRDGGWYDSSSFTRGYSTESMQAVEECIINGQRTLPLFVNEFCTFSKKYISPYYSDTSRYISGQTRVKQLFGGGPTGIYWTVFKAGSGGNIFFYTNEKYKKYCESIGQTANTQEETDNENTEEEEIDEENQFQGSIRIRRVTPNKNIGEYKDTEGGMYVSNDEGRTEEGLGKKEEIPESIREKMKGVSVPQDAEDIFDSLSYLTIPYVNFDGEVKEGHMIVNKILADEVLKIFQELYNIKYPIQNMDLVDEYKDKGTGNVEYNSVDANNTYSFYYMGGETNSTGNAIELNPQINPEVKNATTNHENAKLYVDRDKTTRWSEEAKKAKIGEDTEVYKIFDKYGWTWGGDSADNPKYMHFEKTTAASTTSEETTINSRVYDLNYIPEEEFEEYIENNDYRALNAFTLDKDKKLTIATWTYTSDEGIKIEKGNTINYKQALSKYTMPYEYLIAMAVHSDDKDFCEGLADLAINSEYIIAVEDMVSTTQTVTKTDVTKTKNHTEKGYISTVENSSNEVVEVSESATQTIEVTYVDCWYVRYSKDYSYSTEYLQSALSNSPGAVNISGKKGELIGNFSITAYCNCAKCCGKYSPEMGGEGKTATGTVPQDGLTIAVDPSVIPLGSYVVFNEHVYHAEDTGSAIKGNDIDLYMGSHEAALNWGRKTIPVYWAEDVGTSEESTKEDRTEEQSVIRNTNPMSVTIDAMGKISKTESSTSSSKSNTTGVDSEGYYYKTKTTITITTGTMSFSYDTGNYTISGNSKKFVELYNSDECEDVKNLEVSWLIESLEQNSKTVALCEVTEYLFAQASGESNDTNTLKFDEYKPKDFNEIDKSSLVLEYMKSWENEDLWRYQKDEIPYSGEVTKYITEDKEKYKCYEDVKDSRYFGYSVLHYYKGKYNNKDEYAEVGVDITKYYDIGTELDANIVDQVKQAIIDRNRKNIESKLKKAKIELNENQLCALDVITYQYGIGIIDEFISKYKEYGDTTEFCENFEYKGDKPFYTGYTGDDTNFGKRRGTANWTIFHENKFIASDGKELEDAGSGFGTWDGSGNTFGINIFINGHVNEDNMTKLRKALEDYFGLPHISMPIEGSLWVCDIAVNHSTIRASEGYKKYDYTKALEPAQCTWWAYVRANQYLEAYGTKYKSIDEAKQRVKITDGGGSYGDGGLWGGRYSQVFKSGSTPKTNSLFSYGNRPGHVGYVEAVDGEYMYISHCGSGKTWHGLNKVLISSFNSRYSPTYVYLAEPK